MANYTQDSGSVSNQQLDYFLSQIPLGSDFVIFRTSSDYICVYGDYDGNKFLNSTVIRIPRVGFTGSNNEVHFSNEVTTTVTLGYQYYAYSNIGKGTLIQTSTESQQMFKLQGFGVLLLGFLLIFTIGFTIIKKRWLV